MTAFFAYGIKMQRSTEINSALTTSTPLVISTIFLLSRTRAVIVNAIESDVQNLQRQCRRHQGIVGEWSRCNQYTLDRHVHIARAMQFHIAGL